MAAPLVIVRRSFQRHVVQSTGRNSSSAASVLPRIGSKSTTTTASPQARFKSSSATQAAASLFDKAEEYYTNLRWRMATSLTGSLSKEEQHELLTRLNIIQPAKTSADDEKESINEEQQQKSIAEAVAAARAEEAQKQAEKWEQEKSALLAAAEEATKARVESELTIQHRRLKHEQWLEQVKLEKEALHAQAVAEEQQEQNQYEEEAITTDASSHPVLGTTVADLGYKRVHIASVTALKSLPVWKKQRTYRHKRAKSMAQDKMKTLHLGMPGVIALHEDLNGKLSIIDGQHRVGMMAILEENKQDSTGDNAAFFDLDRILVEVYPEHNNNEQDSSSHAQDIFLEINKAEPVKLVDLPGIALTKVDRKTINEGAKRLEEAFPAMFSASQRCRPPHLNIDNLREALFQSDVVKRHDLKSPKALETWMLERNQRLKEEYTSSNSTKKASKTALQKAMKHDFFLGLDSTWLLA